MTWQSAETRREGLEAFAAQPLVKTAENAMAVLQARHKGSCPGRCQARLQTKGQTGEFRTW